MSEQETGGSPWLAALLVGILALGGTVLLWTVGREPVLGPFLQAGQLRAWVQGLGPWGPLAIVGLQMAQVLVAPLPGQALGLVSGYLFGPWLGTLYSMAGLLLGSWLGAWLARRWGRPLVERLVDAGTLARVDRLSQGLGVPLLFLVFLLPFLPDDITLLLAGLTGMPVRSILLAALFGRLPGVFVSSWLGTSAATLTAPQLAAVVGAVLAVAVPVYRWRASLERRMWALLGRITGRQPEEPAE